MNQAAELAVQEVVIRAKESNFGKSDPRLIRDLYLNLESLLQLESLAGERLPDSSEEMVGFIRRYLASSEVPLGSGVVFNLQGFLESDKVPAEIKDLINRIFSKLDPRDLTYRFGSCSCVPCVNLTAALIAYVNFLEDNGQPAIIH